MKSMISAAILGGLLAATAPALADEAGRLPTDWFVLPEDEHQSYAQQQLDYEVKDGVTYRRGMQPVTESIDKIFHYTASSLESSGKTIGSRQRPADAPTDWVPWHLKEIYMDLGVNAAGTAGLVTGIGEASIEVRWGQSKASLREQGLEPAAGFTADSDDAGETKVDLSIDEYTTSFQLEQQIDKISDAVMATGRVSDRGRMREGLLKVAKDLQSVMVNINAYNDSYWDIGKFGLDVEIGGSGAIGNGMTAGGAVRLRFEWKRQNYGVPLPEPLDGNHEKREEMRKLLASVAKDMDQVGSDLYAGSGFDLTTLRLGLGIYFGFKVGVAKGKASLMGYAFFNKSSYRANGDQGGRPRIITDFEVPLIDDEPVPAHLTYATANNVKYDRVPGGDGAEDRVVYYMTREKFRNGIKRAVGMGAFFAERANKRTGQQTTNKRWEINQLKPQFALSLEGAAKVVTIGGKVSLEMTYKRL